MEEMSFVLLMTKIDRVYTLENRGTSKETAPKLPVVETCIDDIWRKVHTREYTILIS